MIGRVSLLGRDGLVDGLEALAGDLAMAARPSKGSIPETCPKRTVGG